MARIALLACALLLLAGCGGSDDNGSEASQEQTPTQPSANERFGYIRSVSTAGPAATLAFDEAQWLTGEEAQRAAEEDGQVQPGDPVPNDYYVRNPDKSTQTFPIVAEAEITARRCHLCRDGTDGNLADFLAAFMERGELTYADPYRGATSQYWLTIEDGTVVAIDEQYVP